jgi:hypothetical protein
MTDRAVSPFSGMDKLRQEVSQLLESLESRQQDRLTQPVELKSPRPVSSKRETTSQDLRLVLVGLRCALRDASVELGNLKKENSTLKQKVATLEREAATKRLIDRSNQEIARSQRSSYKDFAALQREISDLRKEREKMLSDINSLMDIIRRSKIFFN